jgi:hypothetical protein
MKIPCKINGQPAEIEIDLANFQRGALSVTEAAVYLGCCEQTLRKKVRATTYNTYPVAALNEHLLAEMQRKGK